MPNRDELIRYLDEYLQAHAIPDYGPQGLQVEGKEAVRRVATAVSASLELFEQAAGWGADLILVHHGLFWEKAPRVVTGAMRRRLRLLLENEINLAAYHLCLDRHPELGNNILGARGLGLADPQPWGDYAGTTIGTRGTLPGLSVEEFTARVREFFGQEPLVFPFGPEAIREIGIITGGAQRQVEEAIADGLDAYVTGEASEFVMHAAKEGGIHFFAAGHYATETTGVRALGKHVAEKFGVEARFFDLPNPV